MNQLFSTEKAEKLFMERKNIKCRNYILIMYISKKYLNKPKPGDFPALRG